ncbi:putative 2OG-Fe(II) oxygenase [soil metagenome]
MRGLQRPAEAAQLLAVVHANQPESSIVAHNLAAARGDAGDFNGAISAARRALFLKPRPETWLVLGRSLQAEGDLEAARAAFREAIALRPDYRDALRDLSQLSWMQDRNANAALAPLYAALASHPSSDLAAMTCGVIRDISGHRAAYAFVQPWTDRRSAAVELSAASALAMFDTDLQLRHAEVAVDLEPRMAETNNGWASALLSAGRVDDALAALNAWTAVAPSDQFALALRQAALRMGNRPGALTSQDYSRLVGVFDLDTPSAWANRASWLADLSRALHRLHDFQAEPFGQSIRQGAQARVDPRWVGDASIDATFGAFALPLADYAAAMSPIEPMGARRTAGVDIAGAWSVRLSSGGMHNDHVHPQGWLSSAFYAELPQGSGESREGWLRFGGVELGGQASLPPEYWVEPQPGRLTLFPSYLWHGTEPFGGAGYRLSIAFDARPRPPAH